MGDVQVTKICDITKFSMDDATLRFTGNCEERVKKFGPRKMSSFSRTNGFRHFASELT